MGNETEGLLRAARLGDPRAFSALAEPYRRELLLYSYRLLGSLHDAEDLTQECFLRAWTKVATFEGRASFRGEQGVQKRIAGISVTVVVRQGPSRAT